MKTNVYEQVLDVVHNLTNQYHPLGHPLGLIRTNRAVAKYMLLDNTTGIFGGNVIHFNIKNLGLGIFEISINTDVGTANTTRLIK